jgi:hypothetical protein
MAPTVLLKIWSALLMPVNSGQVARWLMVRGSIVADLKHVRHLSSFTYGVLLCSLGIERNSSTWFWGSRVGCWTLVRASVSWVRLWRSGLNSIAAALMGFADVEEMILMMWK